MPKLDLFPLNYFCSDKQMAGGCSFDNCVIVLVIYSIHKLTRPRTAFPFGGGRVLAAFKAKNAIFRCVEMATNHPVDRVMLGARECERSVIVINPGLHPK